MTIIKSLSIRDDQEEFIQKTNLNLSKFVQQKLDEKMKGTDKFKDIVKNIVIEVLKDYKLIKK